MSALSTGPGPTGSRGSRLRQAPASAAALTSLPGEILEGIFGVLPISDRLRLTRVCRLLHNVHDASASLQYDFTLRTTGYLNIPYRVAPSQASPDSSRAPDTSPSPPASPRPPRERVMAGTAPAVQTTARQRTDQPRLTVLSAMEKNALLKDRERRWETMEAAAERHVSLRGRAGVYEMQEGVFLLCGEYDADGGRPSAVKLIPFPSATDPDLDEPALPVTKHKVPFSIADLTMDPTQDLICISENRPLPANHSLPPPAHRYHLFTMSTFQPHPLAALSSLDFPPHGSALMQQTRQLLQIMGDTLAILVSRYATPWILAGMGLAGLPGLAGMANQEELVAWNWRTGRVMARMTLPENGWFSSFALLTPTTFMVTTTSSISRVLTSPDEDMASVFPTIIQIYSLASHPNDRHIVPQPLGPDHQDHITFRPILLATLSLPLFAPEVVVSAFDVRPDPAFPPSAPSTAGPSLTSHKQFTQNPEKGVLVFDLQVSVPPDRGRIDAQGNPNEMDSKSFELFVLRETLVEMAKEGEERLRVARLPDLRHGPGRWSPGLGLDEDLDRERIAKGYAWDDWGRGGARIMEAYMSRRAWVCSCSGYRFVSLLHHPSEQVLDNPNVLHVAPYKAHLRLLDFSPYSVRKYARRHSSRVTSNGPCDMSNDVQRASRAKEVFEQHVRKAEKDRGRSENNDDGSRRNSEPSACRTRSQSRSRQLVVDYPTFLPAGKVWQEFVWSGLAFREVVRRKGIMANGVMMDDQRVIVVATQGRQNGDWGTIRQDMTVLCM